MPHISASLQSLTYSQEKNIKNRLLLTGYRLSCIGYRWPLCVSHQTYTRDGFFMFFFYEHPALFFGLFRVFRCFRNKNLRDMIKFYVVSLAQTLLI